MRRQKEGWREAECRLNRKNMFLIRRWENVSHAIDIGNLIKQHHRQFSWNARKNILRTNEITMKDDHVKQIITDIINRESQARVL